MPKDKIAEYKKKNCGECGTPLEYKCTTPSYVSRKKFCSRSCSAKWLVKNTRFGMKKGQIRIKNRPLTRSSCGYMLEYVRLTVPSTGKYRLQHRVVMERFLERDLTQAEQVHHIDGNRHNNKIENLVIMNISEHQKLHADMYKIVYDLVRNGTVVFNCETKGYEYA